MQRSLRIAALATLALTFVAGPTLAASNSGKANNGTQALIQKYQEKSKELQQIHQKTLKNNPELKKQQNDYQKMVRSAIKKQGYNTESGRDKLQSLSKKLQSGDLSKSKRKEVMQQFQSERKKMSKARKQAMSQPKIKQARQKLQDDTQAAMKKQNSKTDKLIQSLRKIQKKMRSSAKSSQPQSG
ncbi:hypothetical protein [Salinisphaera orenii]|uniref:hypothetical protein n=1 Tax=Salinisphaera orenii TaxID=856731 RepID=UPI000DBE80D1|nr:hypothetical protein [Salifodinibacter halophilus]